LLDEHPAELAAGTALFFQREPELLLRYELLQQQRFPQTYFSGRPTRISPVSECRRNIAEAVKGRNRRGFNFAGYLFVF